MLLLLLLLLLRVVLLWWAVAVWRLVMAVVTVMAANMSLEVRERGALFATLTELTFRHLWNPCADRCRQRWIMDITFNIIFILWYL